MPSVGLYANVLTAAAWYAGAIDYGLSVDSESGTRCGGLVGLILGAAGRMLLSTVGGHGAMAEKKIEKCAHPGCSCPAAADSKYCGAYCEGSANRPSIACNCRHAECGAGEAVSTAG